MIDYTHIFIHRRKIHPKKSTQNKKKSFEQFFLNNLRRVPDSRHRDEGKSSREFFEKVRVNAVFFLVFWDYGWVFGPLFIVWELISQLHRTSVTQGFLA